MPSSDPNVSILIPTFNQEKFIGACVASALDQTYRNLEVIVSDDASHDATGEITRQFLVDARLRYERNPINIGRVKNYRRLLYEFASGEWVLLLDGDDCLVNSQYIAHAMELARSAPDVVLVFGRILQGQDLATARISPSVPGLQPLMDGTQFFLRHPPFYDAMPYHLSCLFRRTAAIDNQCYRHDIISTDLESFYRLMIGHKIAYIDEVGGFWRQHEGNVSNDASYRASARNFIIFTSLYEYASALAVFPRSALKDWLRRGAARYYLGCLGRMFANARFLDALRLSGYVMTIDIGIVGHAIRRSVMWVLRRSNIWA
jgi:glycosyltransferase involved in cell wall biosynthesis